MRTLYRPVLFWGAILYLLFFLLATITQHRPFIEGLRLVQLGIAVLCTVWYGVSALRIIRKRTYPDALDQMTLGVFLSFFTIALHSAWSLMWRFAGQPAWMQNSDVTSFFVFNFIIAGALHILPPGSIDGRVPPRNVGVLLYAIATACLFAIAILLIHPDFKKVVEAIRPWVQERYDDYGDYPHLKF